MASATTDRRLGLTGARAIKDPCACATTASITLSGEQTIDGVSCVTGNRALVKNQTSSVDNGVYVVDTGTWTRDLDFDGANDVVTGTLVPVNGGTTNGKKVFRVTTAGTITFGSSIVTFEQALFSSLTGATFLQSGTGAVERDAQNKDRDFYSIADFAPGDGTLQTTQVQAAFTAAVANGKALYVPDGTWLFGRVTWTGSLRIFGVGTLKCSNPAALYASNSEWMFGTGTSSQTFICEGVTIDNNTWGVLASAITPAYNDGVSCNTNWLGGFGFRLTGYKSVKFNNVTAVKFKRLVFSYQNTATIFTNNFTDCTPSNASTADYGQVVLACESGSRLKFADNFCLGLDFVTGTTNYGLGNTSATFCWGFNTDDIQITDNQSYGHQLVCRVTTITSVTGRRCTVKGNLIELPPADTAVFGYKFVVISGNTIRKSGDMGISTDNSQHLSITGNVIDGVCVGGIAVLDTVNATISGNSINDVGQDYAESTVSPSTSTAVGINIDSTGAVINRSISVTGNTLWFENLPPATGKGAGIRVPVYDNDSVDMTLSCVVADNSLYIDAVNLPKFVVAAAEVMCYMNTVSGTFSSGEIITGGTSGFKGRYTFNTAARIWFNNPTAVPSNGETITGAESGATCIVEAGGGGGNPRWTGSVVQNNIDRVTARQGQTVTANRLLARY